MEPRKRSLDVLRTLAIFIVFFNHFLAPKGRILAYLYEHLAQGAGIGVLLFFVLSGFLISGLLFKEHQKTGSISFKKFFIRRGFKIYPAFWGYLAITIGLGLSGKFAIEKLLAEVFFVQNYFHSYWAHTWTLAVEEQFYLFLPIVLIIMVKNCGSNPFRHIPRLFSGVASFCLLARLADRIFDRSSHPNHNFLFLIDGFFFGVLIAYFYHYHQEKFKTFKKKTGNKLLVVGVAFVIPAFFFSDWNNFVVTTIGYTFFYLGCGMILIRALDEEKFFSGRFWGGVAFIGSHSYSIYIWHSMAFMACIAALKFYGNYPLYCFLSVTSSICLGVLMARLIEQPALRLREALISAPSSR